MDQMVSDSDCRVDRRFGVFDYRLGEICFAPGYVSKLAGCFAAIQSTFNSDTGTVPDSNPCSYACSKSNTCRDPYCDAVVTKSAAYACVPQAFTPPPIASLIRWSVTAR